MLKMETETGIRQFFKEENWSVPSNHEELTFTNQSFRIDVFSENNTINNENIKIEFDDTQSYLSDENEDVETNYCQRCKETYEDYCLKCRMLSRILDTPVEFNVINRAKKTLPKNILEIKSSPKGGNGIFAIKPISASVIFGPFYGLSIKDDNSNCSFNITKLQNQIGKEKNSNWMMYINLVSDVLEQNLRAFQYNNAMYFQSIKQINKGEELLIFYEIDSNSKKGKYYKPPVEDKDEDSYACVSCCLGFSTRKHLINHKKTCSNRKETSNKIIHCPTCQLYLAEGEFLNGHESSCEKIKKSRLMLFCRRSGQLEVDLRKFKCPKCNYTTSCMTTLQKHYKGNQHENYETPQETIESSKQIRKSKTVDEKEEEEEGEEVKKKFKCPKCDALLSSKGSLTKHLKLHGEKKYVCQTCDKKFVRESHLKLHEKTHTGEKCFFCAMCNYGSIYKGALELHIKNVHFKDTIEKTYQCNICSFKTNGRAYFKSHSRTHLGLKQHICDVCKKAFQEKNRLNRHKLIHTDKKNFLCSQCEKTFRTNAHLKVHVYHSHTEKPYQCDHCNFKSRTKENFDQHMKNRHPDGGVDKKFKCIQCKYQTNDKGNYNKHVNNHNGYRPFVCEICEKGYLLKNNLRMHMRIHTGEKDYKCSDCGKSFVSKQTLGLHLTSHTGDKRLKCSQCDFQTNLDTWLHRHNQKVHPTAELIGTKESANCL